jgi:hypothetical protein
MSQIEEQKSFSEIKRRVEQSRMDARSNDPRHKAPQHLDVLNGAIPELELLEKSTDGELSIQIAAYRISRSQERDRLKTNLQA